MADGFIVRKGGVAVERTTAPSINFVSKTSNEIVVTFTNNDAAEAEIYYGITSTLTDTVTLAAAATSSNITFSGLDDDTAFTVSAYALVTDPTSKKIKSKIVLTVITTDAITFTAATGGTTLEYDDGGKRFRSHTFTSNGTFEVTIVGDAIDDRNKVDYLIIAGGAAGGSGGNTAGAGGGGAGGYRTTNGTSGGNSSERDKVTVTAQGHSITIGAGGGGVVGNGNPGAASSGLGVFTVGGGFGRRFQSGVNSLGGTGGSGGGGACTDSSSLTSTGGTGTAEEGSNGGSGTREGRFSGGGGGGAFAVGQDANPSGNAGIGGAGLNNLLRTGSNETRAGGGGGASSGTGGPGSGGAGGGGGGGNNAAGTSATANTGSGGGGAGGGFANLGGNGGSGIVVIRYEIAPSV